MAGKAVLGISAVFCQMVARQKTKVKQISSVSIVESIGSLLSQGDQASRAFDLIQQELTPGIEEDYDGALGAAIQKLKDDVETKINNSQTESQNLLNDAYGNYEAAASLVSNTKKEADVIDQAFYDCIEEKKANYSALADATTAQNQACELMEKNTAFSFESDAVFEFDCNLGTPGACQAKLGELEEKVEELNTNSTTLLGEGQQNFSTLKDKCDKLTLDRNKARESLPAIIMHVNSTCGGSGNSQNDVHVRRDGDESPDEPGRWLKREMTYEECAEMCQDSATCHAFTFNSEEESCWFVKVGFKKRNVKKDILFCGEKPQTQCDGIKQSRLTKICKAGGEWQSKCGFESAYTQLLDAQKVDEAERIQEWQSTSTMKCLLKKYADGRLVDVASIDDLEDCSGGELADRLNFRLNTFQGFAATEKCSGSVPFTNGETWRVIVQWGPGRACGGWEHSSANPDENVRRDGEESPTKTIKFPTGGAWIRQRMTFPECAAMCQESATCQVFQFHLNGSCFFSKVAAISPYANSAVSKSWYCGVKTSGTPTLAGANPFPFCL